MIIEIPAYKKKFELKLPTPRGYPTVTMKFGIKNTDYLVANGQRIYIEAYTRLLNNKEHFYLEGHQICPNCGK